MADITAYKPFYSVLVLAFFCSLMVAGAAVGLRPLQEANKLRDQKKNILMAAGLYDGSQSIAELFSGVETRIVDLQSGAFVSPEEISPQEYEQRKAAMTKELSNPLDDDADVAGIRRVEKYSLVYLVKENGSINQIILPIRGKGLWSTLYGYIAVNGDMTTVSGISFYEHGETPGLGGEIENPRWQAGWEGKKIYDQDYEESLFVGKKQGRGDKVHHIDGLSGATLTTEGVDDIMNFWFGKHGFKPFLSRMKSNGGNIHG
ncbi:MAG: Na(+)-translocating NADH-quinone reductase subunit C [Desulfopila sp.]